MVETYGVTFREPEILWMLFLAPLILAFFWWRERQREQFSERFASPRVRDRHTRVRVARPSLISGGFVLIVVSLAGPRLGSELVPAPQNQNNRIVAIDVSESMAAEDVGASRLAVAKATASRVIESHTGRVGLVAFEGDAQIIAPLTDDHDAVLTLLSSLQAGELGAPGSDLGAAVEEGLKVIAHVPTQSSDLIVISDGEDQGASVARAVARAVERGLHVSTVTIGSAEGGRIPFRDRAGFLRDESGKEVITRARVDVMNDIARRTGGIALVNPFADLAIRSLARRDLQMAGSESDDLIRLPRERYQWPLAASFLFFLAASVVHRGAE